MMKFTVNPPNIYTHIGTVHTMPPRERWAAFGLVLLSGLGKAAIVALLVAAAFFGSQYLIL